MQTPKNYTPEQSAKLFNVSIESIKRQYLENAKVLEIMYLKAVKTGKKVNNYTADQLKELTAEYYNKSL